MACGLIRQWSDKNGERSILSGCRYIDSVRRRAFRTRRPFDTLAKCLVGSTGSSLDFPLLDRQRPSLKVRRRLFVREKELCASVYKEDGCPDVV